MRKIRGICILLSVALLFCGILLVCTLTGSRQAQESAHGERWLDAGKTVTSAEGSDALSLLSLEDGTVALKSTNEVAWIDRLDLEEAQEILAFYDRLIEGSDNDGVDDFLIEDHTQDYYETAATVTDTLTAANSETAEAQIEAAAEDVFARYMPFVIAAYEAFDRDHPEVFWLSASRSMTCQWEWNRTGNSYSYTITVLFVIKHTDSSFDIRAEGYQSAAAIQSDIAARNSRVATITAAVEGDSAYEQVKYFNEILTKTNEYNTIVAGSATGTAAPNCWESISALVGRIGTAGPVCEGYARAFKVLCDTVGIPCVLVDGNAKTSVLSAGGAHMWNYVQVEGAWYAIDVTWNDPTGGNAGATSGLESTAWFLLGSQSVTSGMTFLVSHPVSNRASTGGVSFSNGPVLSTTACADPSVVPTAVLSAVSVKNQDGSTELTYGDTLTVTVTAIADSRPATNQTMVLSLGGTELARSSTAVNGIYTLTYQTTARDISTLGEQTLTLQLIGNSAMVGSHTDFKITLSKATPTVSFAAPAQAVTYNGTAAVLTAPTVTLKGSDLFDGSLSYSYVNTENADDTGTGLPTGAGVYTVTATTASNDWYTVGSGTVTLTVAKAAAQSREEALSLACGSTGTLALDSILSEALLQGAVFGPLSVTDPDSVLSEQPTLSGGTLSYTLADDASKAGKTVTIVVPVTATDNYLPYSITLTVTVQESENETEQESDTPSATDHIGDNTDGNDTFSPDWSRLVVGNRRLWQYVGLIGGITLLLILFAAAVAFKKKK